MGQKVNPIGFRVGVIRGWESNWYERKGYSTKLLEDIKLRSYIRNRLKKAGVSRIVIDRTSKNLILTNKLLIRDSYFSTRLERSFSKRGNCSIICVSVVKSSE